MLRHEQIYIIKNNSCWIDDDGGGGDDDDKNSTKHVTEISKKYILFICCLNFTKWKGAILMIFKLDK